MKPEWQQLVDYVKSVSPYLWRVSYRQVLVDSWLWVAGSVIVLGVAIYLGFRARKLYRAGDTDDQFMLFSLGSGIATIGGIGWLFSAVDILLNPGYQAVKNLVALFPH